MEHTRDDKIATIKKWLGYGSINIFGLPYAGKDTHGRELAELLDGELLGGGDILRNSDIPKSVRAIMERGELIPTDDYISIVLPYLSSDKFTSKPLILSSVGRWLGEEDGVLLAAEKSNHPLKAVIHLSVDDAAVWRRFERAKTAGDRETRADDADGILTKRLDEYRTKTLPVIESYRQKGLLIEVDGLPPRDAVLSTIIDELAQLATA